MCEGGGSTQPDSPAHLVPPDTTLAKSLVAPPTSFLRGRQTRPVLEVSLAGCRSFSRAMSNSGRAAENRREL